MIVIELRQWQDEYWSENIPHGVAFSPFTSSIYYVTADGSELPRRIDVAYEGNIGGPKFSPNGQWVYFQAKINGQWQILRCDLDGSGIENLTKHHTPAGDRYGFSFSRDGTKVVYTYHNGKIGKIAMMDPNGANPILVAPELGYHYMGDIHPDNQSVVFAYTEQGYTLMLKRLDTETLTTITPGLQHCFVPSFTPDGKSIIFFRRGGDIYRVNIDGDNLMRLTWDNNYDTLYLSPRDQHGSTDGPCISPDGKHIVYIAKRKGIPQVHIMDVDGSHQRQLTFGESTCGRVKFDPDGCRIAFVSWTKETLQLFTMYCDGSAQRQITDLPGAVCWLDWYPGNRMNKAVIN